MKITSTIIERREIVYSEAEWDAVHKVYSSWKLVESGPLVTKRSFPRTIPGKFQLIVERVRGKSQEAIK